MTVPENHIGPNSDAVTLAEKLAEGTFWTFANVLSLLRAVLVIPIIYLILSGSSLFWLIVCIAVGIVSDWLDGTIARLTNTVSEWGKILDPIADKIAAIGIVLALAIQGKLPWGLLAIVFGRDILIVLGGSLAARRFGTVSMSMWTGKVAITMLAFTVLGAVMNVSHEVLNVWIYTSGILFVYSFLLYLLRYRHFIRTGTDSGIGAILDRFANEITCAMMVTLWSTFPGTLLEPWTGWFAGVVSLWAAFLVVGGLRLDAKGWGGGYPPILHAPVTLMVLMALGMFLEPDADVITYGQWIAAALIGYAALLYLSYIFVGARRDAENVETKSG